LGVSFDFSQQFVARATVAQAVFFNLFWDYRFHWRPLLLPWLTALFPRRSAASYSLGFIVVWLV